MKKTISFLIMVASVGLLFFTPKVKAEEPLEMDIMYEIEHPWEVSMPEEVGIEYETLENIIEETHREVYKNQEDWFEERVVGESHQVDSLLVIKDGQLIKEYYRFPTIKKYDVGSVTKSITSLLIGIAIDEGYIEGVEQKIIDFFPEIKDEPARDPRVEEIKIRHLLQMTSGFEWNEWDVPFNHLDNDFYYKMNEANNPVNYVLEKIVMEEPGTKWDYNSGNSHLLSAIIKRATGMKTEEFAREKLFNPLKIDDLLVGWSQGPQDVNWGGVGLWIHPKELAKIGQLCLDGGEWQGEKIVSKDWIRDSFETTIEVNENMDYGYQWWVREFSGVDVYSAEGGRGAALYIVPEFDLIVAVDSDYVRAFHLIADRILARIIEDL